MSNGFEKKGIDSLSDKKYLLILVLVVAALVLAVISPLFNPTGLTVLNDTNESNSAPFWSSEYTYFAIQSGSNLILDLNDYFTDPDDDALVYTATQPSNFTVVVTDNMLTLTPDPGFTGTRSISIIASDDSEVTDQTILVDILESNETQDAIIKDDDDKFYGNKLTDEPLFETRFISIEQV